MLALAWFTGVTPNGLLLQVLVLHDHLDLWIVQCLRLLDRGADGRLSRFERSRTNAAMAELPRVIAFEDNEVPLGRVHADSTLPAALRCAR